MGNFSHPDMIDSAILRPGRLDRHLFCGLPDKQQRAEVQAVFFLNLDY